MRSRNLNIPITVIAAVVGLAIFGTVLVNAYAGLTAGQKKAPTQQGPVVTGAVPAGLSESSAGSGASSGNAASSTLAAPVDSIGIAQPAPGVFSPGGPPYGTGGVTGDGISGWGVAYRQTSDANAQPDAALIKAAYQDAEKKVNDLGAATGNKVGKLLAMTDYGTNQPYFKGCIGPAVGKPVPGAAAGSTGSGSAPGATTIAPAPPVAPCQVDNNHYLVVWVFVRHALG